MKTDWESAFNELLRATKARCSACDVDGARIIRRHTHRTEEDLPKSAWHWVNGPRIQEWNLAYFGTNRSVCHIYTSGGCRLEEHWYNEHRMELEIGPEIVPPREES